MIRPLTLALLAVDLALGAAVWAAATGRLGDGGVHGGVAATVTARPDGGGAAAPDGPASPARAAAVAEGGGLGRVAGAVPHPSASAAGTGAPPLFRAAVPPPPVEEPTAPPPPDPPPRLLGVIIGGTGAIAVLQAGDAPPVRLGVQDQLDGWTVTRIEAKRVVVQRGEEAAMLRLDAAADR